MLHGGICWSSGQPGRERGPTATRDRSERHVQARGPSETATDMHVHERRRDDEDTMDATGSLSSGRWNAGVWARRVVGSLNACMHLHPRVRTHSGAYVTGLLGVGQLMQVQGFLWSFSGSVCALSEPFTLPIYSGCSGIVAVPPPAFMANPHTLPRRAASAAVPAADK